LGYTPGMNASDLITVDPDILGGTPVLKGTRVPVKTLFEYLENNHALEEFLECFPSVTREAACRVFDGGNVRHYLTAHDNDCFQ
jgi:uncharacterized protein (DUF433 family)